jgi:putative ABC transport system permease protein
MKGALRRISQAPAFAITVIATLALTAGLSTTVFSVLDAVFLRPLPYKHAERIFALRTYSPQGYTQPASYPEFVDWRRESSGFSILAVYNSNGSINAELGAEPGGRAMSLRAVATSDNFFDVFGVRPLLGRTFEKGEEDPGRQFVAVLSYEVWRTWFGARRAAIGAKIQLAGRAYTVVGVMPPGFRFPIGETDAVYFPLSMTPNLREGRGSHWLPTVARLAPGISWREAESRYNRIFARLGEVYPDTKGRRVQLIDAATFAVGRPDAALHLLAYAVLALLAIGCVNLAGLLFARGVRLEHEVAIRSALGAGRWQLTRQMLADNVVYAAAGGALGVLLAYGLLGATSVLLLASLNRGAEVGLNWTVLVVSLGISMLTSLLAGLWPALRLADVSTAVSLRAGSRAGTDRRQQRLRGAFIAVQVSLALVLVVTSGLVFRALARLQHADFGFDPAPILTAEIDLSLGAYENRDVLADFYTPLLERVRAIPGVRAAGLIQLVPIQSWGWDSDVQIVGQPPSPPNEERLAEVRRVTPGYLQVFGIQLVRGRFLDEKLDTPGSLRVMVVNERFVQRFIPPGLDPLEQAIMDGDRKVAIAGVVRNIRQSVYQPPLAEMDFPTSQIPPPERDMYLDSMQLVIRTAGRPEAIGPDLRRTFANLDKTLPYRAQQTMNEVVAAALTLERLENWLFGSFAILALVLALVGIYGLISHEVELSRRDLGIRIALGATSAKIFGLVYRRVGAMVGAGIGVGVLALWAARRLIGTVAALDPGRDGIALLALVFTFAAVSLLAAFVPARRAATADPLESLRSE